MKSRLVLIGASMLMTATLLSGCATTNRTAQLREAYVMEHPNLTEMQADAILNGRITLGMTEEMVMAAWGVPTRVQPVKEKTEEGAESQWFYGNYFVGGSITELFFDKAGILLRYEVSGEPNAANSVSSSLADNDAQRVTPAVPNDPGNKGANPPR